MNKIKKHLESVKKLIYFVLIAFKPQRATTPYLFLASQFGHVALSLAFCYIINSAIPILIFWFIWETIHLLKSRDAIDFVEDLTFEWLGVLVFVLFSKLTVVLTLLTIVILTFIKFRNNE